MLPSISVTWPVMVVESVVAVCALLVCVSVFSVVVVEAEPQAATETTNMPIIKRETIFLFMAQFILIKIKFTIVTCIYDKFGKSFKDV